MHGQRLDGHIGLNKRTTAAYLILCICAFALFAPGRIAFPDDEIVYQTTASLWDRGELAIDGIPKRTGEPKGQPDGTFGWAKGVDGKRYGFFGHALSMVALPMYALARATEPRVPEAWRHAVRSDHFYLHRRSLAEDWPRLVVSLTNCFITAIAGWLLIVWCRALGYSVRAGLVLGLAYAFGTLAFPYAGTFLSEPLSAALLLAGAIGVTRFHADRDSPRWLWGAAIAVGVAVHAHVLNLVAVPCFLGYALWPIRGELPRHRKAWGGALAIGTVLLLLLGWSHYARYGSPLETGRYGLYSHFIVPGEGLLALLVSPGRSFLLLSPALLVALPGWRPLARRVPAAALFAAAVVVTRLLFVSMRSDWWGGWAIGARFLLPAVPFALVPLAAVWDGLASRKGRLGVAAALLACVAMQAHLAAHSIFEWMTRLHHETPKTVSYLSRSHWELGANPLVGFFDLKVDMLSVGAVRLAQHGHSGLAWVFGVVAAVGVAAAVVLVRQFVLRPRP